MKQELERKIMDDFSWFEAGNVFTNKKLGFPHPCECQDGWFNLIYNWCKEIDELYKSKKANIKKLKIYQIKEKYGTLNLYIGNYIDGVDTITGKYENLSHHTCEICGNEASLRIRGGWYQTLCWDHTKELGYRDVILDI